MPEMISITQEEKERLEARAQKSALDKSYLQLIIRLMNRVSATSGLENLIGNLLHGVADVIGGLNIILYYRIDDNLHYTDVYGRKEQLERIDDPLVQQVFDSRTTLELEHEFSDTKMATAQFGSGYTWVVPLLVGPELVGVLKLESLNIAMRELYQQLPVFFNHAALILKNELQNYALLKSSFEQLQVANRQLSDEILQRQRAENHLRITQFAMDNTSDSLLWITPDARIVNVNESTCRRLGYSREELLRMTVFDVDPAFPREAWEAHWQKIQERKSFTIETRHHTKNGQVFPVEVSVNYVEHEGAAYNFAFARDISERKKAEEELLRVNEELEQRVLTR